MYLTDEAIHTLCTKGNLIEPYDVLKLQPTSYDLTLGNEFLKLSKSPIPLDPTEKSTINYDVLERKLGEPFIIEPGQFLLATTKETVNIPRDLSAKVKGKSSIGRLGLAIQNAGHIDPGFKGQITLELHNAGNRPIDLSFVERICQIIFVRNTSGVSHTYRGKYQNQENVTGSKSDWEYPIKGNY